MWLRCNAAARAARVTRGAATMQLRSQQQLRKRTNDTTLDTASDKVQLAPPQKKKSRAVGSSRSPRATQAVPKNTIPLLDGGDDTGEKILYRYPTLVAARLIRRYKRFLADVVLVDASTSSTSTDGEADGADAEQHSDTVDEAANTVTTIYCPNTGPMVGLLDEPNALVQLSKSDDPKRKYSYTLEMIRIHNGERHVWVGVHSSSANYMVERALQSGWFQNELGNFDLLQREVKFAKSSRVDFVLTTLNDQGDVAHQKYVEVKSVTLAQSESQPTGASNRCAVFPDTVSVRASKHVAELMELVESRRQQNKKSQPTLSGAIVFLVQRDDCDMFMPSVVHDPKFAKLCAQASASGIQLVAYACSLEPRENSQMGHVRLLHALPFPAAQDA